MREILNEINKNFAGPAVNLKTGEIFPTNLAPIIISEGGVMAARPMFWGFPKWKGSGVIINARAETAADKPMFRSSLAARRCIVPSTGFYEWSHSGDKKQKDKYLINLPDTPMLYMAGIYNYYHESDGQQLPRFVILTTAGQQQHCAAARPHAGDPQFSRKERLAIRCRHGCFIAHSGRTLVLKTA